MNYVSIVHSRKGTSSRRLDRSHLADGQTNNWKL